MHYMSASLYHVRPLLLVRGTILFAERWCRGKLKLLAYGCRTCLKNWCLRTAVVAKCELIVPRSPIQAAYCRVRRKVTVYQMIGSSWGGTEISPGLIQTLLSRRRRDWCRVCVCQNGGVANILKRFYNLYTAVYDLSGQCIQEYSIYAQ